MSLFSALRRPTPDPSGFSDSATILPWHAFDAAIERSLKMLHGVHIPVSLFTVRFGELLRGDPAEAIGDALCQFGSAGRLADGRIALLYLGPRSRAGDGDVTLVRHLHSRIEQRLKERGWAALCRNLELAAAHGWTDELDGSTDLVRLLEPGRPFTRMAH